jgi:glycosyltransferase involved in cell wall biosynthesis
MTSLTWVILPAFNEETYLDRVLKKLKKKWDHIIVVDDGSSDNTSAIAKKYTRHVLRHSIN